MDIHEEPEISKAEKVTRFGCGALFGAIVAIYFAFRLALSSFGLVAAIIVVAVLVCGFLALKHGDNFWYAVLGKARWWW
jgi:hypothetical protein